MDNPRGIGARACGLRAGAGSFNDLSVGRLRKPCINTAGLGGSEPALSVLAATYRAATSPPCSCLPQAALAAGGSRHDDGDGRVAHFGFQHPVGVALLAESG